MTPFGSGALRFALPGGADRRALFAELRALPGAVDVVLTEELGLVTGNVGADAIRAVLASAPSLASAPPTDARTHVIRVAYDGEDLEIVAAHAGMSRRELIAAHTGAAHAVAMLGFLPGFAYLRGVPPALSLPRRNTPRTRVPAGSVAIAAGYTGIYPFASPGGWHLLGTAIGFSPFDGHGAVFAIGDRVRFEETDANPASAAARPATPAIAAPSRALPGLTHGLEVTRALGLALLVDRGRPGHMHEGVPPGGPLVPESLARANLALGNPPDACAIEVFGTIALTARGAHALVADDACGAVRLRDGETLTVSTDDRTRARYLAVPGGFDVPPVLGSRSTLLVAGIGGHEGRALRRGDVLFSSARAASHPSGRVLEGDGESDLDRDDRRDTPARISIDPGPDLPLDLPPDLPLDAILAAPFRISPTSDRTGVRLEGPPIATSPAASAATQAEHPSAPMVRGAIQLTPRGLVVLGPDHPTTGGYPVLGILRHDSLGRFFGAPLGAEIRFTLGA